MPALSKTPSSGEAAPPARPHFQFRPASSIAKRPILWLWERYIPRGDLTLMTGDGQAGKSTVICDLAARLSIGRPLIGESISRRQPEKTWLLSSEDSAEDTIIWRLENQGADLSNVYVDDQRVLFTPPTLRELHTTIQANAISLCVIDTLTTWLGDDVDMNRANEVTNWLEPLRRIAKDTGCAFLMVRHRRKGGPQDNKLHAGMGSVGFTATVRSELMAIDKNDGYRTLERSKGNVGAPPPVLCYTIDPHPQGPTLPGVLRWCEEFTFSGQGPAPSRIPAKLASARQFLFDVLKDGPAAANELLRLAAEQGISEATLKKAKQGLALSSRIGKEWVWELDPKGKPGGLSA
jgi:hypothetical protein